MHCFKAYLYTILFFTLLSCGSRDDAGLNKTSFVSVKDGIEREVKVKSEVFKIMALCPSMTEIIYALDNSKVVARTIHCDYPKEVEVLKSISVYPKIDYEELLRLDLDLIVSLSNMTPTEEADKITRMGIPVLLYDVHNIETLKESVFSLARVLNKEKTADFLVKEINKKVGQIKKLNSQSYLALASIDPIYIHGDNSWFDAIVSRYGYKNIASKGLGKYPRVSREYILKTNPEVLFYKSKRSMDSTFFELYPELKEIRAYKNNEIYSIDSDLASRPTLRGLDLLNQLERIND